MRIYDVFNKSQIIQTDLTEREIAELFDVERRVAYNMCHYGTIFYEQYYVIEVDQDEPITEELACEWDTYVEKLKRRLCC